mgnify:CR=1 FL=1
MPELPEVEVTRLGIESHIIGQTIHAVEVRQPQLRWPVAPQLSQLAGQPIQAVKRRAKYLLLETPLGTIMVHLGMSGSLRVLHKPDLPGKHDHVDVHFTHGLCLRYNDPRRFGSWLWIEAHQTSHTLLDQLAPEPLSVAFDATYLQHKIKGRRRPIKVCLMDQSIVVGVGNIYANEVLFKTGIHPERIASTLSLSACQDLVTQIKRTLEQAIAQGGTTLKDFSQSDGQPGYFAQKLCVYGRKHQPCLNCATKITEFKLGQRATFMCEHCQV